MTLELIRTKQGLVPVTDDAVDAVRKIKEGEAILVDYKPKRNVKFHRKFFALLNAILPNQSVYKTVDQLLEVVKYRSGHFETFLDHKGNKIYRTKSIAFHNMDEVEFEIFYNNALDVCIELTDEEAVHEILKFI